MPWLPKSSVVVPVDFSDESIAAVDCALELVKNASRLHVIHVLSRMENMTEQGLVESVENDARRKQVELSLRERLPGSKYEAVDFVATVGDPGHEIAAFAESISAELIVMPSHGRTGLSRLLIGSVAERVVRLAHCPVLVLKKGEAG